MSNEIYLALLALIAGAITTTVSPMVLTMLSNRHARQQKQQDYARQDLVAQRVIEAEERQIARQAKLAALAKETTELQRAGNQQAAEIARSASTKLDTIHTLVNSNLTASLQAQLDGVRRELVLLTSITESNAVANIMTSADMLNAADTARSRIGELEAMLKDRSVQQKVIETKYS